MGAKLLFFAQSSRWMGRDQMECPVALPKKLGDLLQIPELAPLQIHLPVLRIAVNEEFAGMEDVVREGDEIAFLPPVSGG